MRGWPGGNCRPAQVLAADQRVNAWARELRQAGVEGSMDELRAMAFLDLLLSRDSRPTPGSPPGSSGHHDGDGTDTPGRTDSGSPADGDPAGGDPGPGRAAGGRRPAGPGGPGPGPGPGGR